MIRIRNLGTGTINQHYLIKVNLDEVGTLQRMKQEMERYQKFNTLVFKTDNQNKIKMPKVDIKEYAKYLLK